MKRKNWTSFCVGLALVALFAVWTACVCCVDVQAVGPQGSKVGFAALNGFIHTLIGVNMPLYTVTDWLGLVPIGVCFGFAILGLVQWIQRKNILKVDASILALGVFYLVVMGVYILFEYVVINYRPVLINGYLEASYPSSTTMLVLCVMPTAIMQFSTRIKNRIFRRGVVFTIVAFILFMVIGRLASGVHWLSDIIGGGLISAGLVCMYYPFCHANGVKENQDKSLTF
jgi:undecaprenyl-diphosphatase